MADIEHIRHSLAHLLATAVLEYDPKAKLAIGPTIENGFYYDILFSAPLGAEMMPKFEKKMRGLVKRKLAFERIATTPAEARKQFADQPLRSNSLMNLKKMVKTSRSIRRAISLTCVEVGMLTTRVRFPQTRSRSRALPVRIGEEMRNERC